MAEPVVGETGLPRQWHLVDANIIEDGTQTLANVHQDGTISVKDERANEEAERKRNLLWYICPFVALQAFSVVCAALAAYFMTTAFLKEPAGHGVAMDRSMNPLPPLPDCINNPSACDGPTDRFNNGSWLFKEGNMSTSSSGQRLKRSPISNPLPISWEIIQKLAEEIGRSQPLTSGEHWTRGILMIDPEVSSCPIFLSPTVTVALFPGKTAPCQSAAAGNIPSSTEFEDEGISDGRAFDVPSTHAVFDHKGQGTPESLSWLPAAIPTKTLMKFVTTNEYMQSAIDGRERRHESPMLSKPTFMGSIMPKMNVDEELHMKSSTSKLSFIDPMSEILSEEAQREERSKYLQAMERFFQKESLHSKKPAEDRLLMEDDDSEKTSPVAQRSIADDYNACLRTRRDEKESFQQVVMSTVFLFFAVFFAIAAGIYACYGGLKWRKKIDSLKEQLKSGRGGNDHRPDGPSSSPSGLLHMASGGEGHETYSYEETSAAGGALATGGDQQPAWDDQTYRNESGTQQHGQVVPSAMGPFMVGRHHRHTDESTTIYMSPNALGSGFFTQEDTTNEASPAMLVRPSRRHRHWTSRRDDNADGPDEFQQELFGKLEERKEMMKPYTSGEQLQTAHLDNESDLSAVPSMPRTSRATMSASPFNGGSSKSSFPRSNIVAKRKAAFENKTQPASRNARYSLPSPISLSKLSQRQVSGQDQQESTLVLMQPADTIECESHDGKPVETSISMHPISTLSHVHIMPCSSSLSNFLPQHAISGQMFDEELFERAAPAGKSHGAEPHRHDPG